MTDETAEIEVPELKTEQDQEVGEEPEATASAPETEEDEVMVTIGEEAPPPEEHAQAPEWVRELRKQHRQLQREKRDLEEKLKSVSQPTAERPIAVGKKPTLEEHDYDADKYETELAEWFERKRKADEAEARARAAEVEANQAWQAKLDGYGKAKADLKVRDFEDAEAQVSETFSVTQQGVLLQGADNPALLVYALGKNPSKAKELASIKDPVKFAFAVAKLETQLKVQNRKAATPPEKTVRGTGPVSGAVDSTLERLRAEAEKSGDFTKVMAYKRQQRAKR